MDKISSGDVNNKATYQLIIDQEDHNTKKSEFPPNQGHGWAADSSHSATTLRASAHAWYPGPKKKPEPEIAITPIDRPIEQPFVVPAVWDRPQRQLMGKVQDTLDQRLSSQGYTSIEALKIVMPTYSAIAKQISDGMDPENILDTWHPQLTLDEPLPTEATPQEADGITPPEHPFVAPEEWELSH